MKRVLPLPTPEQVRMWVHQDGETFYWNPRPRSEFSCLAAWASWTARCANKPITIKKMLNGYDAIRINGVLILVHRLIWALHYGEWPKGEIDHINGVKLDNRIENLRDVDKSLNMRNQKRRSDNTSGHPGVTWCRKRNVWRVVIRTGALFKYVGQFADREEAIAARVREQVNYGFTPQHGRAA